MFGKIDHIGVAVEDIDAALELYAGAFEMTVAHRETVEAQGVEAACSTSARAMSSCCAARPRTRRSASSSPARAQAAPRRLRGRRHRLDPGEARRRRLELIDSKARVGIRGSRVAFLQPRSTGRVLTEIVEPVEGALMADAQKVEIGFEGGGQGDRGTAQQV
jgi:catechol 2,3-dioxygenase-like lactoylglutathione lyase family enzyme